MRKMVFSVIALLAAIVMAFLSTQAADSIETAVEGAKDFVCGN